MKLSGPSGHGSEWKALMSPVMSGRGKPPTVTAMVYVPDVTLLGQVAGDVQGQSVALHWRELVAVDGVDGGVVSGRTTPLVRNGHSRHADQQSKHQHDREEGTHDWRRK